MRIALEKYWLIFQISVCVWFIFIWGLFVQFVFVYFGSGVCLISLIIKHKLTNCTVCKHYSSRYTALLMAYKTENDLDLLLEVSKFAGAGRAKAAERSRQAIFWWKLQTPTVLSASSLDLVFTCTWPIFSVFSTKLQCEKKAQYRRVGNITYRHISVLNISILDRYHMIF